MPFVNIRLVKDVIADDPKAKKDIMAKAIKDAIRQVTGLGDGDVWIVFEEVAARDWYIGHTDVGTLRKGAGAGT